MSEKAKEAKVNDKASEEVKPVSEPKKEAPEKKADDKKDAAKSNKKNWIIAGSVIGGIILLAVIAALLTRPQANPNNGGNDNNNSSSSNKVEQVYTDLKEVDVNGMTIKDACAAVRQAGWKVSEVAGKNKYSNKSDCSDDANKAVSVSYHKEKYYTYSGDLRSDYETVTIYYNDPKEESSSSSSSSSSNDSSSSSSNNSSSSNSSSSSSNSSSSSSSSSSSKPSSSSSSTSGYQSIYNTYAARLRNECPYLSTGECYEVCSEGTQKMADYWWDASGVDGQYETYSEWAGKLFDVYMEEAR